MGRSPGGYVMVLLSSPPAFLDTCAAIISLTPPRPLVPWQVLQWLLPSWVPSRWLTLFTQPWEGDVTMTLPMDVWATVHPGVNPTPLELQRLIKVGVAEWEARLSRKSVARVLANPLVWLYSMLLEINPPEHNLPYLGWRTGDVGET